MALGTWAVGCQVSEGIASVGLAATVVLAVVRGARAEEGRPLQRELSRFWPLWLFTAWAVVGPLLGGHLPTGTGLGRLSDFAAIPFAAFALGTVEAATRRRILWAAAIALGLSCLAAGLQSYGVWPSEATMLRLSHGHFSGYRVYEPVPGTQRFMGGGLLFHRLKFAHVTGLAILGALAVGLSSRGRARAGAFIVAGLALFSVAAFPYARAALAALLAACVVVVGLSHPRTLRAFAGGTVLALVLAGTILTIPSLRHRFSTSLQSEGNGEREALWATGWRAASTHPLFGIGLGNFRPGLFADRDTPAQVLEHPGKSHNQYLTFAAELGFPGLGLFLAFLVWLGASLQPATPERAWGWGALTYFFLLALFHDPLFHAPFSMALALCLSACARTRRQARGP